VTYIFFFDESPRGGNLRRMVKRVIPEGLMKNDGVQSSDTSTCVGLQRLRRLGAGLMSNTRQQLPSYQSRRHRQAQLPKSQEKWALMKGERVCDPRRVTKRIISAESFELLSGITKSAPVILRIVVAGPVMPLDRILPITCPPVLRQESATRSRSAHQETSSTKNDNQTEKKDHVTWLFVECVILYLILGVLISCVHRDQGYCGGKLKNG